MTTEQYSIGYDEGYQAGWNEAMEANPAQQQAYEQANPLGGPAKVFDAMANAIRAGDDYHSVLRQYGYAEAQQEEPAAHQRTDYAAHLHHCNIGEWEGTCKYGDPDCPALAHAALRAQMAEQPAPGRAHYEDGDVFERIAARKHQPAQRKPWVGLTDEEIQKEFHPLHATGLQFARAIEAKLKGKNT